MPAAAMVGAAVIGGVASNSAAGKTSDAARDAARAQTAQANYAIEVENIRLKEATLKLRPWQVGEAEAYAKLAQNIPGSWQQTPGYGLEQLGFAGQAAAAQQYADQIGGQIPQVQGQLGEVGDIMRGSTQQYMDQIPGILGGAEQAVGAYGGQIDQAMAGSRSGLESALAGYEKAQALQEGATAEALGAYGGYGDQYAGMGEDVAGALGEYTGVLGDTMTARRAAMADYESQLGGTMDALGLLEQERLGAVNQGAAAAGELYSGRRGEALAEVGGEMALARAREQERLATQLYGARSDIEGVAAGQAGQAFGAQQSATAQQQGLVGAQAGMTAEQLAAQQQLAQATGMAGAATQQSQLQAAQMQAGLAGQQLGAQQYLTAEQQAAAQQQYGAQQALGSTLSGLTQQQQALLQPLFQQQLAGQTGAAQATGMMGAGQQQYYQNYVNMLERLGSPQVTQNLAALSLGQAAQQSQLQQQATAQSGQLQMQAALAAQQGTNQMVSGMGSVMSGLARGGYFNSKTDGQGGYNPYQEYQFNQQYGFAPGYGAPTT